MRTEEQDNRSGALLNANFVAYRVLSARKKTHEKRVLDTLKSRARERTITRH